MVIPSAAANARDMTGKGGIGLLQSSHPRMNRLPTLLFRYWRRRSCWELLVGVDLVSDQSHTAVYYKSAPTTQVFMLDANVPEAAGKAGGSGEIDRVQPWFFDTTHIFTGIGVHRMVHSSSDLSVTLGLRGIAQFSSTKDSPRTGSALPQITSELALLAEVPFQVEYFLSDHSSFSASVAITASISSSFSTTNENDGGLVDLLGPSNTNRGGVALELGGRYSGGVGYTYYF